MSRFTVEYRPEEEDRLAQYCVVEWTYVNPENGAKCGDTVWKTYNLETGRDEAEELAAALQEEYNREFYAEFG